MQLRIGILSAAVTMTACSLTVPAMAEPNQPGTYSLSRSERQETLDTLLDALNKTYVFPETARKIAEDIRARTKRGEYDSIADGKEFARKVTADLQSVSHDKHLRVGFNAEVLPPNGPYPEAPTPEEKERIRKEIAARNGGFVRLERLDGNIGYLRLDAFMTPEMAGDTATAAMNFLADTDALIVDLRQNGGGDPAMIALISSYLFGPEPVHLNDLYWRPTDTTQQFWTLPHVPGRRFGPEKPVFVLTSSRTFSGAEEFSNNLKVLKRATLVGETTGGGAHPGGGVRLSNHFSAFIPTGRAINPITKGNWEGTGVEPDVKVAAEEALHTAQVMALKRLSEAEAIPPLADERRDTLARLTEKPGR